MKYSKGQRFQKDWIITSDGLNRTFNVYIPTTYSNSPNQLYPLSFMLHGGNGTGDTLENGTKADTDAETYGFVLIYAEGLYKAWNAGNGCCGQAWRQNIDDTGFISTLIDYFVTTMCINSNAIFSAGMSNGAVMSHTLACRISDKLAAITAVEGTLWVTPCQPSKPVSIFQVWGTEDQNMYWQGGVSECGVTGLAWNGHPYTMNAWLELNQCQCQFSNLTTPPPLDLNNPNCSEFNLTAKDGSDKVANVTGYGICKSSTKIQLAVILGGGHSWSGSGTGAYTPMNCSNHVSNFPVNKRMLQFFLDNQRMSSKIAIM